MLYKKNDEPMYKKKHRKRSNSGKTGEVMGFHSAHRVCLATPEFPLLIGPLIGARYDVLGCS
jgi:hypothetical protein